VSLSRLWAAPVLGWVGVEELAASGYRDYPGARDMVVKSDRRYVRVYDDDLRRDYPEVWTDDRAIATWLRLLSVADKMWPTIPEIPRYIKPGPLAILVGCGLVEALPAHCYRIRGHDAERNARSNAARNAAAERWHSERNADGNADVMPRRERERDENESTPPPAKPGLRKNGTNPRALGTNPRANGTSPRQERESQKRGPTKLHDILTQAAKAGHE
jgi:hypothetical protein